MNSFGLHIITIFFLIYFQSTGFSRAQWSGDSSGVPKIHLDMRTALSEGNRLRMGGASIGWEWGTKRDEVTLGYYWTGARGRRDIRRFENFEYPSPISGTGAETDLRFVSGGYWMTIRDWPRWKLSSPLEAGFGRARFLTTSPSTSPDSDVYRIKFIPVQLAMYGEWKATKWLGAGIQVGYRHYLSDQRYRALRQLGGGYYRFRVLVYMQTLRDWRGHLFRKEPLPSPFY